MRVRRLRPLKYLRVEVFHLYRFFASTASRLGAEIVAAAADHNHSRAFQAEPPVLVPSHCDRPKSQVRFPVHHSVRGAVRLFAFDECKYILESINAFDQVSQQAGQQQQAWGECIDFFSEMKKSKIFCSFFFGGGNEAFWEQFPMDVRTRLPLEVFFVIKWREINSNVLKSLLI